MRNKVSRSWTRVMLFADIFKLLRKAVTKSDAKSFFFIYPNHSSAPPVFCLPARKSTTHNGFIFMAFCVQDLYQNL